MISSDDDLDNNILNKQVTKYELERYMEWNGYVKG